MDVSSPRRSSGVLSAAEERSLIKRAKRGDEAAISTLYRAYVQPVYRYVLIRIGDSNVAEDLTGEVFLRALEALPRYRLSGAPFASWLFQIAHARIVDFFRRQARRPRVQLEESLPTVEPGPDDIVAAREALGEVIGELVYLTDEQQTVLQYRFLEEWSLEQTAQMMGKSVNAVKALQHRALRTLARRLER